MVIKKGMETSIRDYRTQLSPHLPLLHPDNAIYLSISLRSSRNLCGPSLFFSLPDCTATSLFLPIESYLSPSPSRTHTSITCRGPWTRYVHATLVSHDDISLHRPPLGYVPLRHRGACPRFREATSFEVAQRGDIIPLMCSSWEGKCERFIFLPCRIFGDIFCCLIKPFIFMNK